jgi:hypothetical protein
MHLTSPAAVALVCLALSSPAQEAETRPPEPRTPTQKLSWPDDAERVVCTVDGKSRTATELLRYIDEQHHPGFLAFVATPAGKHYFQSPLPARWVREYADVLALRSEIRHRELDPQSTDTAVSTALKQGFANWLDAYGQQREREGAPLELTQERVNTLLTRYQTEFGLQCERQGLLDALVAETPAEADGVLRAYYQDHARVFGGRVTFAQILIQTRDPRTGELLTGDARRAALEKLAEVRTSLAEDGSNFEDIARRLSDDRRTAPRGGILEDVMRFDPLLPAQLCRAAWELTDGAWTGPVESPYGLHFVKRLSYRHVMYVLYNDKLKPVIQATKRTQEQEDLMIDVRHRHAVELRY